MGRSLVWSFVAAAALVASGGAVAQEAPRLPRVFIESTPDGPGAIAVAEQLGPRQPVPLGARVVVADAGAMNPQLSNHLTALAERQIPLWLAVVAPRRVDLVAGWQLSLRRLLAAHGPQLAVFEVLAGGDDARLRRFVLQTAATEARAAARSARIALGTDDDTTAARMLDELSSDEAPYVNLIASEGSLASDLRERLVARFPAVRFVRRDRDAGARPVARERLVRDVLETVGTTELASAWRGAPDALAHAVRALAPAADLLTHDVDVIEPAAAELTVHAVPGGAAPRLLFDEHTFATYLIYDGAAAAEPLAVGLRLAASGDPVVIDLIAGTRHRVTSFRRDEEAARVDAGVPLTGRPMLVNFSDGAATQFVDRTGVQAERTLAVEEIIARQRQYQARHDRLLDHYRASARMEQHFRPSLTDPGYDVVTENEYFVDDDGVEWEERSFAVNGSKWGSDRPPFPLLQPEKVLSLPLELRLDQDYRYVLDGTERVGDTDCYRVHFEPTRQDTALYRGTVWIDRQTFARRRVRAVQTRTAAPVVSNEEIHTYEPVAEIDGVPLLLLTRLTARQIVLIAGRNLLLEKAATFSNFRVNDEGFAEARQTARQGTSVMYRDTERGVRYYVKDGESRVVSERATASARAMAMGVLIDPSFAFPLPIFGINYLDFEFRGQPDTQFALLFGGVLAAGNLQKPKLAGTNLDASLDFFGIAAPASDRLFVQGGERKSEALLTWPLSTGVNLGWQYTAFQKAQAHYQVRYDPFVRDRSTDASYVVPSSTITQGVGASWEYKRGGYSLGATGTYFARGHWKPWGPADALDSAAPRTYTKYAAHVTRDFFLGAFQKVHVNGSYFGGSRLDRFSRYQFGLFDDTRIHGVPASGVRFDDLGMVRGSYSFNLFEQYRLDLFAEQAWGRDRSVDNGWQPLTGLGFAVNLRAPWNTILRADMGKSLLPNRYSGAGSTVLQIMLLKPLGGR